MPKQVKPTIMFLVLDYIYMKMKSDLTRKILLIDESWSLLSRTEGPIIIGKLMYSESDQAWNTIRLRKEILQRFPQLKEKREAFRYKMNIYHDFEHLLDEIKNMKEKSDIVPILLMLCRKRG